MYNVAPEAGLASLLASRGRGGDTMLVHMGPEEVAGLRRLAMAHGGDLEVNPDTGLYQANFLKKILPMVVGAILPSIPVVGPALSGFAKTIGFGNQAIGTGLLIGGASALIEGDLKKGLMAGLGAYSGATIAGGLQSAAQAAVPEAASAAQSTQALEAAKQTVGAGEILIQGPKVNPFTGELVKATTAPVLQSVPGGEYLVHNRIVEQAIPTPSFATSSYAPISMATALGNVGTAATATAPTGLAALTRGTGALFTSPEARTAFGRALGGGFESGLGQNLSRYATLAGVADALTPEYKMPSTAQIAGEDMFYIPGERNPLYGTGRDQPYFLPGKYYKKTDKGLVPIDPFKIAPGYAAGGQVAPMDSQQALPHQGQAIPAPNHFYPLSTVTKTNYAANPQSREILSGYEANIDPFTGEEKFAEGGAVSDAEKDALIKKYEAMLYGPPSSKRDISPTEAYLASLSEQVKYVPPPPPPPAPPIDYTPPPPGTVAGGGGYDPSNYPKEPPGQNPYDPNNFYYDPSRFPNEPVDTGNLNWNTIGDTLREFPLTEDQLRAWEEANLEDTKEEIGAVEFDPTKEIDEALDQDGLFDRALDFVEGTGGPIGAILGGVRGGNMESIVRGYVPDWIERPAQFLYDKAREAAVKYVDPETGEEILVGESSYEPDPTVEQVQNYGNTREMLDFYNDMMAGSPYQAYGMGAQMPGNLSAYDDYGSFVNLGPMGNTLGGGSPKIPGGFAEGGMIDEFGPDDMPDTGMFSNPYDEQMDYDRAMPMPDEEYIEEPSYDRGMMQRQAPMREQAPMQPRRGFMFDQPLDIGGPMQDQGGYYGEDFGGMPMMPPDQSMPMPMMGEEPMYAQPMPDEQMLDYEQSYMPPQMMPQQPMPRQIPQQMPMMPQVPPMPPMPQMQPIDYAGGAVGEDYNFGFAEGGDVYGDGMQEYRAGGKLLNGPGDGMSDDIPAVIRGEQTQRAALADGEFVVPADVVSHLGNGSTNAGAKKLYQMMARIRHARTGKKKQAPAVKVDRYMPA